MRSQETGDSLDSEFGICLGFRIWSLGFQPVFRLWSVVRRSGGQVLPVRIPPHE